MHRPRRIEVLGIVTLTASALRVSPASAAANHPNTLLIQADALGCDDLSINGNTGSRTPNIDRLAESSVRFRIFTVWSVCSPVFHNGGYATDMWGRWHSGKANGKWPWDRGFDEGYFAELYKCFPCSGFYNEFPPEDGS